MAIDSKLTAKVIGAIPIGELISAPVMAMIEAQVAANKAYLDFLMTICIKKGKAVGVDISYNDITQNADGSQSKTTRKLNIPLLALVTHPNLGVESGLVTFSLDISDAETVKTKSAGGSEISGGAGYLFGRLNFKGWVSGSKETTRVTDTRSKYYFETKIARQPNPEALSRIIDLIMNSALKPVASQQDPMAINAESFLSDRYSTDNQENETE